MVILAELSPPGAMNSFNAPLVGWLVVIAIAIVLPTLVSLKALRRNPSFDVELTKVTTSITALNALLKTTTESLNNNEEAVAALRERLTGKVAIIDGVAADLKEIKNRLVHGDEVMAQLREKQSANAAIIVEIKGSVHEQNLRLESMQRTITSLPHKKP